MPQSIKNQQTMHTERFAFSHHLHFSNRSIKITSKLYNLKISMYSRFRLIGPPVNRVSRLIGPHCEERNLIKENTLPYIHIIGPLFRLIGPQL